MELNAMETKMQDVIDAQRELLEGKNKMIELQRKQIDALNNLLELERKEKECFICGKKAGLNWWCGRNTCT